MNSDEKKVTEYNDSNNNQYNNTNNSENNESNTSNGRKVNLPNKLTIFRIVLVPVFMIFIIFPVFSDTWAKILAAALIFIAAITDLFDGMIARKLHLVTDFGKFLDPLADKFLVVGALLAITASQSFSDIRMFSVWATAIVFFRELAVTSLRLVANTSDGNVIAANFTAKLKTVFQCVCILTILLENIVLTKTLNTPPYLFSYITMAIMLILTIYSGFIYFKTYWHYIDPTK
ncbi:MAG: CDP-diacylglycerol--glycerol-3-phosphate 3-phosphatidyltransferase [Oscillospiraceae bacterium]|nr:CDP-diacylglycerol--glycerol-3-phosphate 3-phosphatidyltransferase [Oscillospiraceae bacterium]